MVDRLNIPANVAAVFSEDGRVFYDLSVLISDYTPVVERQAFGANILKTDINDGIVTGMNMMLNAIRQSRDVLLLDAAYEED